MSDLINREEALAYPLSFNHYDKQNGNKHFIYGVESYREYIEGLPTVEQKHGHWIDVQRERWIYAKCSECGKVSDASTPYCAYCGSKNNEVTKDE